MEPEHQVWSSQTQRKSQQEEKNQREREYLLGIPHTLFEPETCQEVSRKGKFLTGVLSTTQYSYPKLIQDQLSEGGSGEVQFFDNIFCYTRVNKVYFWRYQSYQNFMSKSEIVSRNFDQPITAVAWNRANNLRFAKADQVIVAIAFGQHIQLFKLCYIIPQFPLRVPILEPLSLTIQASHVVTSMKIFVEASQHSMTNFSALIYGDDQGNVNFFDLVNTKQYQTCCYLSAYLPKSADYHEVKQIFQLKDNLFVCLVNCLRKEGKFFGMGSISIQNNKNFEQQIRIYQISPIAQKHNNVLTSQIIYPVRYRFQLVGKLTSIELINHAYECCSMFFGDRSPSDWGKIQTINLFKDTSGSQFVQALFKTGLSLKFDEFFRFSCAPVIAGSLPNQNFTFLTPSPINRGKISPENEILASCGSVLLVYKDRLVSENSQTCFFTPFYEERNKILKVALLPISNDKENQPEEFIIFSLRTMTVAKKITPKCYLIAILSLEPGIRHKKIKKLIEALGEQTALTLILQLLFHHLHEGIRGFHVRQDVADLIKNFYVGSKIELSRFHTFYVEKKNSLTNKHEHVEISEESQETMWAQLIRLGSRVADVGDCGFGIRSAEAFFPYFLKLLKKNLREWNSLRSSGLERQICSMKTLISLLELFQERKSKESQDITISSKLTEIYKKIIQKLCSLLQLYKFLHDIGYADEQLPLFRDLVTVFNQNHRLQLLRAVFEIHEYGNLPFIQSLDTNFPELELKTAIKFFLWKKQTQRESSELFKTDNLSQLIHPLFYEEIVLKLSAQSNHFQSQQIFPLVLNFLSLTLTKISELTREIINLSTIIHQNQPSREDHFVAYEWTKMICRGNDLNERRRELEKRWLEMVSVVLQNCSAGSYSESHVAQLMWILQAKPPHGLGVQIQKLIKEYSLQRKWKKAGETFLFSNSRQQNKRETLN